MPEPTPLRELCALAKNTIAEHITEHDLANYYGIPIVYAQLIARLDPETVMKVYGALEWAERELVSFHDSPVQKALDALDGKGNQP